LPSFAAAQAASASAAAWTLLLHQWKAVYPGGFIIKNNVSSFFNTQ
jgi:hypothetical protein